MNYSNPPHGNQKLRLANAGRPIILLLAIPLLVSACSPKRPTACSSGPGEPAEPPAAAESGKRGQPKAAPGGFTASPHRGASAPIRPKPAGRPARSARSGHVVAFRGWRPEQEGRRDVVWVSDPGDNMLAKVGNRWNQQPHDLPIHYGRRRPTLVLEPARVFTITGAVVIEAEGQAGKPPHLVEVRAEGMPDLTQDFNPAWPGLCGPTSVADVLFSMEANGHTVLAGFPRGPGSKADAGVIKLVSGDPERITPHSLAGRMGIGQDAVGATNIGMREGAAAWLDEQAPDRWNVRLAWLDDDLRTREEQQAFFGRLAAAVASGGGAVLCLWSGAEFADEAVEKDVPTEDLVEVVVPQPQPQEPTPDTVPAGLPLIPQVPDAAFPAVRQPEPTGLGLPGNSSGGPDAAAEATAGQQKLALARARAGEGKQQFAFQLAMQAVERLDRAAAAGVACEADLAAAVELCRSIEIELKLPSAKPTAPHTEFK